MPHQSIEQRREYNRKYRLANSEKIRGYQIARNERRRKIPLFKIKLHSDTDKVLKGLPNPFGSFEKATYVIFKYKSKSQILYSFTTTCRNAEDCIEIMKEKFILIHERAIVSPKYCSIYKIQNGIKELIFREVL